MCFWVTIFVCCWRYISHPPFALLAIFTKNLEILRLRSVWQSIIYQYDYRYCHSEMDNQRRAIEESRTINLRYFTPLSMTKRDIDTSLTLSMTIYNVSVWLSLLSFWCVPTWRAIEESPIITLLFFAGFCLSTYMGF